MSFVSTLAYPLIALSSMFAGEDVAESVVSAIDRRSDAEAVREALIVRLTNLNAPTMFSQEIVDTLAGADLTKRLSYTVAPFSPTSGGGGCVVIAQDENKETYVLLGKKANKQEWEVPAGFMKPITAINPLGLHTQDTEAREDYEVNYMKGSPIAKQPIQRLTDRLPEFDRNLMDTAIRETREETGLALRPEQLQLVKDISDNRERDSAHGKQTFQQLVNFYLADLRSEGRLPTVHPHDDLPELAWVKLKDMQPSPLYPPEVEKAIGLMRENELTAQGVTKEAVATYMAKSGQSKPATELGSEAMAWHEQALHAAQTMGWTLAQMKPEQKQGPSL